MRIENFVLYAMIASTVPAVNPQPDGGAATAARIRKVGAKAALDELYADNDRWDLTLQRISTGSKDWLAVANALKPVADAGASYELSIAVGNAIERAPADVLRVCQGSFEVEEVCGQIGVPPRRSDWPKLLARVDTRRARLKQVRDPKLAEVRDECLAALVLLRPKVQELR